MENFTVLLVDLGVCYIHAYIYLSGCYFVTTKQVPTRAFGGEGTGAQARDKARQNVKTGPPHPRIFFT